MSKTVFERQPDGRWIHKGKKGLTQVTDFNYLLTALESMCGGKAADTDLFEITGKSQLLTIYKNGYKTIEGDGKLIVFADLNRTAFFEVLTKTIQIFEEVERAIEEINKDPNIPKSIEQARSYCTLVARSLDQTLEPKFVHIRHPLLE